MVENFNGHYRALTVETPSKKKKTRSVNFYLQKNFSISVSFHSVLLGLDDVACPSHKSRARAWLIAGHQHTVVRCCRTLQYVCSLALWTFPVTSCLRLVSYQSLITCRTTAKDVRSRAPSALTQFGVGTLHGADYMCVGSWK